MELVELLGLTGEVRLSAFWVFKVAVLVSALMFALVIAVLLVLLVLLDASLAEGGLVTGLRSTGFVQVLTLVTR